LAHLFSIIEMVLGGTNNLVIFVSLTSYDDHISSSGATECGMNRLTAVSHNKISPLQFGNRGRRLSRIFYSVQTRLDHAQFCSVEYALRIFGAWIIRGDNHHITQSPSRLAHEGPFARVTISATAKDGDQPLLGELADRTQGLFKRVWFMGIIHNHSKVLSDLNRL
jgi:hypothetical protein